MKCEEGRCDEDGVRRVRFAGRWEWLCARHARRAIAVERGWDQAEAEYLEQF